jgi:hypothetical protein
MMIPKFEEERLVELEAYFQKVYLDGSGGWVKGLKARKRSPLAFTAILN